MGAEDRAAKQARVMNVAEFERVVGPIQDYGAYAAGCPACGDTRKSWTWCPGKGSVAADHTCPFEGQHLHYNCGCGYPWVTYKRDDPRNRQRMENNIETCILSLKALVRGYRGEYRIEKHDLDAARPFTLMLDDSDPDGAKVIRLVNPGSTEPVPPPPPALTP